MNNQQKIEIFQTQIKELQRQASEVVKLINDTPHTIWRQQISNDLTTIQSLIHTIQRTSLKLHEDLVCSICLEDINENDEIAFSGKLSVHAHCVK